MKNEMNSKKVIFLTKANNNVVSRCKCQTALIGEPMQMDCPWCGCGWTFICAKCHKVFTFAQAQEVDLSWEQLAHNDLDGKLGRQPTAEEIRGWIGFMKILLKDIQIGRQYAYIDGWIFGIDEADLRFDGWHARHELSRVPQASAVKDPTVIKATIGAKEYWDARRLKDQ